MSADMSQLGFLESVPGGLVTIARSWDESSPQVTNGAA